MGGGSQQGTGTGAVVITAGQCRRYKLQNILERAGQEVLTYTLLCGMPGKSPNDSLLQYLDNLPPGSTANYTKMNNPSKCFNSTDMAQINRDPSCTTFDITLLHKAIKVACENVAGSNEMVGNVSKWSSATLVPGCELEHLTTKIKDTRNAVVHECQPLTEAAFRDQVTTLSGLLDSSLRATKDRYGRDDAEYQAKRDTVLAAVRDIQQESLGEEEILQKSARNVLPYFKLETDRELRGRLDAAKYLDPLHFLSGLQIQQVEVNDIFCDIMLAEEKGTGRQEDAKEVPYLEVLGLCNSVAAASASRAGQERPQVLVVEGEAGGGKTTWVTFLLSQWLMPRDRRRMYGLHRYDLLLWVVCRDRSGPTLRDFLRMLLPRAHITYGNLLLPLLKQCRVLVVIDGLDERNDISRQLVADILAEAAGSAFTVVCTSRPQSVQDMKAEAQRMHYQVSHVRMLGITHKERTELVVRHYTWVSGGAGTAADTQALRRAVPLIVQRELFRLPLNLLFLATLFHFKPDTVSTSISHSELYQFIHKWCLQKLHARLGASTSAGRARVFRQDAVERVLRVLYEAALKGLLQNRVCLDSQDLQDVRDACTAEGLDAAEVLPAFYCLRREVSFGTVTEMYQAPHKGLQEFFCAMYVAERVRQYREGAIARVLQGYTAGRDSPYDQLGNMFQHLLGLLTRQRGATTSAMKEVVDLLQQSGMWHPDDWLHLLSDTAAPDAVVQHAAKDIPEGGTMVIMDDVVPMACVLLQHLPQRKVEVTLHQEPADVDGLARALARHNVRVLKLHHHYRHPQQHPTSATVLQCMQGRHDSGMFEFKGHLDAGDLCLLPRTVARLSLAVRNSSHARQLLPALTEALSSRPDLLPPNFAGSSPASIAELFLYRLDLPPALARALPSHPRLHSLKLHISVAAVTPRAVTRLALPSKTAFGLSLSDVTDQLAVAAKDIVVAMCPHRKGFRELRFPGATLEFQEWKNLLKKLQQARVKVGDGLLGGISLPDTHISEDEEKQLCALTSSALGCGLSRSDKDDMWFY